MSLSQKDIENIADRVARKATEQTLVTMGIDASNPIGVQKDMAYLRSSRKAGEHTARIVKKAIIPMVVMGLMIAVWQGFGDAILEIMKKGG